MQEKKITLKITLKHMEEESGIKDVRTRVRTGMRKGKTKTLQISTEVRDLGNKISVSPTPIHSYRQQRLLTIAFFPQRAR